MKKELITNKSLTLKLKRAKKFDKNINAILQ